MPDWEWFASLYFILTAAVYTGLLAFERWGKGDGKR